MNDKIQSEITLDFNQHNYVTVLVKQYDEKSRYIHVTCTRDGILERVESDNVVTVKMKTPDGRNIFNGVEILEDGTLLVEMTYKMLCIAGEAPATIAIYNSEMQSRVSTMDFTVIIVGDIYDDRQIVASDEFNALTRLMNHVEQSTKIIDTALTRAELCETNTKIYQDNANTSSLLASASETNAKNSEDTSYQYMTECINRSVSAEDDAMKAKSYAVGTNGEYRPDDATNNAEYFYQQVKSTAEGLGSLITPMGTVAFENLPALSSVTVNSMYNISNDFVTTDDFVEGAGHSMPMGTNVYKTASNKWDCFAGSPVTGVKGDNESTYRKGNVNITKANIGLDNVENKSSDDIRNELTSENVENALGYFPANQIDIEKCLIVVSFDESSGTLVTRSYNYEG